MLLREWLQTFLIHRTEVKNLNSVYIVMPLTWTRSGLPNLKALSKFFLKASSKKLVRVILRSLYSFMINSVACPEGSMINGYLKLIIKHFHYLCFDCRQYLSSFTNLHWIISLNSKTLFIPSLSSGRFNDPFQFWKVSLYLSNKIAQITKQFKPTYFNS